MIKLIDKKCMNIYCKPDNLFHWSSAKFFKSSDAANTKEAATISNINDKINNMINTTNMHLLWVVAYICTYDIWYMIYDMRYGVYIIYIHTPTHPKNDTITTNTPAAIAK